MTRPAPVSLAVLMALALVCVQTRTLHAQIGASAATPILVLPYVQYGAPLRVSAGLAFFRPTGDNRSAARGQGLLVEGGAGQSGARAAVGAYSFEEYLVIDGRLVIARTWGSPLRASSDSTYAGVEAGLSIAYVRVSTGVARRLSGPAGAHATAFFWSIGLQIPLRY